MPENYQDYESVTKAIAKATDLEVIHSMKTKTIKLQENGKWVNGFEILGKR